MSQRHWYLFSYDIRDPKRWRRVHKIVNGYGKRLQVFPLPMSSDPDADGKSAA